MGRFFGKRSRRSSAKKASSSRVKPAKGNRRDHSRLTIEALERRDLFATLYLDTNGSAAGFGTGTANWNTTSSYWNTNASGTGATQQWVAGSDAVIAGTARTVNVAAAISANSVTFSTSGHTIQGSNSITLGAGGISVNTGTATINSVLTGSSGLAKNGAGALTLGGANTFTGNVNISEGTIKAGSTSALGTNCLLNPSGGTLDVNGYSLSIGRLGNGTSTGLITNTGADATLTVGGQTAVDTYLGKIQDAGAGHRLGLTIARGSGADRYALYLSGTNNTYSGVTTILGADATGNNAWLVANATNCLSLNSAVTIGAGSFLGLEGYNQEIASLSGAGGVSTDFAGSLATLTVGRDNTNTTFSGIIYDWWNDHTGKIALTKVGTGTLTLSGQNVYTGGTTIQAGTLKLGADNALSNAGVVSMENAGVFDLNGHNVAIARLNSSSINSLVTNTGANATLTLGGVAAVDYFQGMLHDGGTNSKLALTLNRGVNGVTYAFVPYGTNNTYSGDTTLVAQDASGANAVLIPAATNALSPNSALIMGEGSRLQIQLGSQEVASLAGSGTILTPGAVGTTTVLTVGRDNSSTTYSGIIQDYWTGHDSKVSITKVGTGTLTLSGQNVYTGGTTIQAGTLKLGSDNALSNAGVVVMAGSSVLDINGHNVSIAGLQSSSTASLVTNTGANATLTLGGVASDDWFAGRLQDGGANSKLGLTIYRGANGVRYAFVPYGTQNTYSGDTTLVAQDASGNHASLIPAATNALSPNSALIMGAGSLLQIQLANQEIASLAGSGTILTQGAVGTTTVLTIGRDNRTTTFSGIIEDRWSSHDAKVALTKVGTGTLTLSGQNLYTGTTTVSAGILDLQSVLSGQLVVNGGFAIGPGANAIPTLAAIPDPAAILEDAGMQTIALSGISAGGSESQSLRVTASSSNTALIPHPTVTYTSPGTSASLSYTPVANASGTAVFTVTVRDAGRNGIADDVDDATFQRQFTVTVTAVNDLPTLDSISDPAAILEDAGMQTITLSGISAGGSESQSLRVTASSSNTALIPDPTVTYTSPGASGSLSYTPVANASGTAVITVTVRDAGANGTFDDGDDATFQRQFTVNVTPVNDLPTLDSIPDPAAILEDTGMQTITLSGISAGGSESQSLRVTASSSNTALIPHPTVTYTSPGSSGSLSYTPVVNASGTAVITVTVRDAGLNGIFDDGDDATFQRQFTVNIAPVNDLPTLDSIADPAAILEDAGMQTITLSGISAGGSESQSLRITASSSNTALIPDPTVTYTSPDSSGSLSYTPVADASGTAVITVTVRDAGLNGIFDDGDDATFQRQFTVNIAPVNDLPTLDSIADPAAILEDAGMQTITLSGISAGGSESQSLRVTASSSNTALIPDPTVTYTSPDSSGSLSYTPVANASGTAVITVTVRDAGLNGIIDDADDATFQRQFTVTVSPVNEAPVLNGSNPLATLGPNPPSNPGILVSELLAGKTSDADGDPMGIAIVATTAGTNCGWQYRLAGAPDWSDVGSVPNGSARLLAADTLLRYVPATDWTGVAEIAFRAWDGTYSSAGSLVSASATGGGTAFSSAVATAQIMVTSRAVTINTGTLQEGWPGLPEVSATYPTSTLTYSPYDTTGNLWIALPNASYYITVGTDGTPLTNSEIESAINSSVSGISFANDGTEGSLTLVFDPGVWGWDATYVNVSGRSSGISNNSGSPGSPAVPGHSEIQTVQFTPQPTGGTWTLAFGQATTTPLSYNASAYDVQTALATLSSIGAGNVSVGGNGSIADPFVVTFIGTLANTNVAQLTADGSGLTTLNHAPALSGANDLPPVPMNSPATSSVANLLSGYVTEADSDPVGIAVTSVDNSHGTWQYWSPTLGWTAIEGVTNSQALLLRQDATLRFSPQNNWHGTAGITFHAWDGSANTTDTTARGGISPFSVNSATAFAHVEVVHVTTVQNGDETPVQNAIYTLSGAWNGGMCVACLYFVGESDFLLYGYESNETIVNNLNSTGYINAWSNGTELNQGGSISFQLTGPYAGSAGNYVGFSDYDTGYQLAQTQVGISTSEVQAVSFLAPTIGGTWTLSLGGYTTNPLAFDATAADVQAALQSLPNIGVGNVSVTESGGTNGSFAVTFQNGKAGQDLPQITVDGSALVTTSNHAPVLSGANYLPTIAPNPASNPGMLVSALLAGHASDVDGNAVGIAVVAAAPATEGVWQYQLPGNNEWSALTGASVTEARLLPSNALLRFVPAIGWVGAATITFHAWDGSQGTAGNTADVAHVGHGTAYSAAAATSETVVTARPVSITATTVQDGGYSSGQDAVYSITGNSWGSGYAYLCISGYETYWTLATINSYDSSQTIIDNLQNTGYFEAWKDDTELNQGGTVFVRLIGAYAGNTGNGVWLSDSSTGYSLNQTQGGSDPSPFAEIQRIALDEPVVGGTWTLSFNGYTTTRLAYNASANEVQAALNALPSLGQDVVYVTGQGTTANPFEVSFNGWLGANVAQLTADGSRLAATNHPPVLAGSNSLPVVPANTPMTISVAGLLAGHVSDVDNDTAGIAVTACDNSHGTWQYRLAGGNWHDLAGLSPSAAMLLPPDAQIGFIPHDNWHGTTSITFYAWDRTSGAVGDTPDMTVPRISSPFSTTAATATARVVVIGAATVQDGCTAPIQNATYTLWGATVNFSGSCYMWLPGGYYLTISTYDSNESIVNSLNNTGFISAWSNGTELNQGGSISFEITGPYAGSAGSVTAFNDSGTGYQLTQTQSGITQVVEEVQSVTFLAPTTGGTWTLSFAGHTTSPLAVDATAANVQAALASLSNIGAGNVSVTGSGAVSDPFVITFQNDMAGQNLPQITVDDSALLATRNHAPILSGANYMPTLGPNPVSNPGMLVSALLAGHVSDSDNDSMGIAVVATSPGGGGEWQYRLAGDGAWSAFTGMGGSAAWLLPGTATVRFAPTTGSVGTSTITFRAWDGSQGTVGYTTNVSHVGYGTAFSTATATSEILVTARPVSIAVTTVQDGGYSSEQDAIFAITRNPSGTGDLNLSFAWAGSYGISIDSTNGDLIYGLQSLGNIQAWSTELELNQGGTIYFQLMGEYSGYAGNGGVSVYDFGDDAYSLSQVQNGQDPIPHPEVQSISFDGPVVGGTWTLSFNGYTTTRLAYNAQAYEVQAALSDLSSIGQDVVSVTGQGTTANPFVVTFYGWSGVSFSPLTADGSRLVAPNAAPVLSGANDLSTIAEDLAASLNSGTLVADLVAGKITDVDSSQYQGIAVIGLTETTSGTWQYSTDGTNWLVIGTASDTSALLLAADGSTRVRFLPSDNWNGVASLTFRAWDQTSGSVGDRVDTTANGGTSAFSTATATASITVTSVNDAPVLNGSNSLATLAPNPATNPGILVSDLLAGKTSDGDNDPVGIAVTATTAGIGCVWEYQLAGSTDWSTVGSLSNGIARLLAADTRLRYVPATDWTGVAEITFRAWDGTYSSAGSLVPVDATGGTTAFSSTVATARIMVTSRAVTVNTGTLQEGWPGLPEVPATYPTSTLTYSPEDTTGNLWLTVPPWVYDGAIGADGTALTNSEIESVISGWLYRVSFANDSTDGSLTLVFDPDEWGWDAANATVSGRNASITNIAGNLGSPAVPGTNEIQTVQFALPPTGGTWTLTFGQATTAPLSYNASASDVQTALAALSGIGAGNVSVTGSGSIADPFVVSFIGALANTNVSQLTADGSGLTTLNHAPALSGANELTPIDEDTAVGLNSGTLVADLVAGKITDVDSSQYQGIAVIGLTETDSGTWQFSTDGTIWYEIGIVSDTSALLLAADGATRVRFLPNANWNGVANLTFRAWDQTTGQAGNPFTINATGNISAFSTATATASITVTPINDAPNGTNTTIQSDDDTPYTFTVADFGFSDPNDTPANALAAVKITTLPSAGSLTLDGANVTAGDSIGFDQILYGLLQFTPAANANGTNYASFTFQVQDDGGTEFGGADTSTPNTITFNVTSVNDAPTLDSILDPAAILEDAGMQTIALSGISAGGRESQSLRVTASSSDTALIPHPTVTYTSPDSSGSLSYTPVANASGTAVITVTVRDAGLNGSFDDEDDATFQRQFTVNVAPVNDAPTIATPASVADASPTTKLLSVLGADVDASGEAGLTYTWAVTGLPAGAAAPTFSDNNSNAAKNATVKFSQAGTYTFRVTISDGALSAISTVTCTVGQVLTTLTIAPANPSVMAGETKQFVASGLDQFGMSMTASYTWESSIGTITQGGLFTAPSTITDGTVTARDANGTVSRTVPVTMVALPSVSISAVNAWTSESSSAGAAFLIGRSGPANGELTVNFSIVSGDNAASDSDYNLLGAANNSVTFADGVSAVLVRVQATADELVEWNERVQLALVADDAYIIDTSHASALVTIQDANGVATLLNQNADWLSTGESQERVENGGVSVSVQQGDLLLTNVLGVADHAPGYVGNEGAFPIVVLDVAFGSDLPSAQSLVAEFRLASLAPQTVVFAPNVLAQSHRYAFQADARSLASGRYDYTVRFAAKNSAGVELAAKTVSGTVAVVNRSSVESGSSNAFGAGWWVDGLWQLVATTNRSLSTETSGLTLVRSDNSAAYFEGTLNTSTIAVVDSSSSAFQSLTGSWASGRVVHDADSSSPSPAIGGGYLAAHQSGTAASARWSLGSLTAGIYELFVTWDAAPDHDASVHYTVTGATALTSSSTTVDQRSLPGSRQLGGDGSACGQGWRSLGYFRATGGAVSVQVYGSGNGIVTADAVASARVEQFVTPDGTFATLQATSSGFVLSDKFQSRWEFDGSGRLVDYYEHYLGGTTPQFIANTHYAYASGGNRLVSIADQTGLTTTYTYGVDGRLNGVIDFAGRTTTYAWAGSSLSVTLPAPAAGGSAPLWQFHYTTSGQIDRVTDATGSITEIAYGAHHRVTSVSQAKNTAAQSDWQITPWATQFLPSAAYAGTAADTPVWAIYTDPCGHAWKYQTDAYGYVTALIKPADQTAQWSWTRDKSGLVLSFTEPAGGAGAEDGDGGGVATGGALLDAIVTNYTYDSLGNRITATYAAETDCECIEGWTYDPTWCIVIAHVLPGHPVEQWTLDATGLVAAYTESGGQLSRTTTYTRTPLATSHGALPGGLLLSVAVAQGTSDVAITDYSYYDDSTGAFGLLQQVARRNSESDSVPDLEVDATVDYEYDLNRNLRLVTQVDAGITIYQYDALNRLVRVTQPDPDDGGPLDAPQTAYTYDAMGRVLTVSEIYGAGDTRVTYHTYDAMGRLQTTTRPDPDGPTGSQSADVTTYSYYDDGQVHTVTDGLGHVTTYTYTANGQLLSVAQPAPAITVPATMSSEVAAAPLTTYVYDVHGNLYEERIWQGTTGKYQTTRYSYDELGQVVLVEKAIATTSDGIQWDNPFVYVYDAYGVLARASQILGGNAEITTQYTYDSLWRLISEATTGAGTTTYSYDLRDNVISTTDACGKITTYQYDKLDRVVRSEDNDGTHAVAYTTHQYDRAGHLLATRLVDPINPNNFRQTSYTFDGLGRVTSVTSPDPDGVGGQVAPVTSYYYNNAGDLDHLIENGRRTDYTYDRLHRQTGVLGVEVGSARPHTTYTYDALDRQVAQQDLMPGGGYRTTDYVYDAAGRLYQVIAPPANAATVARATTTYYYDAAGNLRYTVDPLGYVTENQYDGLGRLSHTIQPHESDDPANVIAYSYDSAGQVTQISESLPGRTTTITRDYGFLPESALTVITTTTAGSLSQTTTEVFDALGRRVCYVEPSGKSQTTTYNGLGYVVESTESPSSGDSLTTRYGYDAFGQRIASTDPNGVTSWYSYDNAGRATTLYRPDWSLGVNPASNPVYWNDSTASYDSNQWDSSSGMLVHEGDGSPTSVVASITVAGGLAAGDYLVLANWFAASTSADAVTYNVSVSSGSGLSTTVTQRDLYPAMTDSYPWQALGIVHACSGDSSIGIQLDATGATGTVYFTQFRVIRVAKSQSTYNVDGTVATETNSLGQQTTYAYDAAGRLTSVTEPEDTTTGYAYDFLGRRTSLTDAIGNTTYFDYDNLDRQTTETIYVNGPAYTRTYSYDLVGRPSRLVDRLGRVTEFGYNLYGLTSENWYNSVADANAGANPVHAFTWSYDDHGRLIEAQDTASHYTYTYDDLDRLTSRTSANAGAPTVVLTTGYGTRTDGLRTSLSATIDGQADFVNEYVYDGLNQMVQVKQHGVVDGRFVRIKQVEFTWDSGRLETVARRQNVNGTFASVITTSYVYDGLSRIKEIWNRRSDSSFDLGHWQYTYDSLGRPTSATRWAFDAGCVTGMVEGQSTSIIQNPTYSYDANGQLLHGMTMSVGQGDYTYDTGGNRTSRTLNGIPTATAVIGDHNRLLFDGFLTYEYDAEGNRTSSYVWTDSDQDGHVDVGERSQITDYTWDHRNRLTSVVKRGSEGGATLFEGSYTYDVDDQLISILADLDGAGTNEKLRRIDLVYDGDQIVLQFEQTAVNGVISAVTAADLAHRYLWGPAVDQILADEHVKWDPNLPMPYGAVIWTMTDRLGSVTELFEARELDGALRLWQQYAYSDFGEMVSAQFVDRSIESSIGYTGRLRDPGGSGLQNNHHRWYDPNAGRWLSEDPLGFAAGDQNLYRYVFNAPIRYTDPSGEVLPILVGALIGLNYWIWKANAVTIDDMAHNRPLDQTHTPYSIDSNGMHLNSAYYTNAAESTAIGATVAYGGHVLTAKALAAGVSAPTVAGFWAGSATTLGAFEGREAYDQYQKGNYAQAVFHSLAAGSSVTSGARSVEFGFRNSSFNGAIQLESAIDTGSYSSAPNANGAPELLGTPSASRGANFGSGFSAPSSGRLQPPSWVIEQNAAKARSFPYNSGSRGSAPAPGAAKALTQAESSAVSKINNILTKNFKQGPRGDISGAIHDMVGNPIPKPGGGTWDHVQDLGNMLRGLRNNAAALSNATDPAAVAARQQALQTIQQIEGAIKGAGL